MSFLRCRTEHLQRRETRPKGATSTLTLAQALNGGQLPFTSSGDVIERSVSPGFCRLVRTLSFYATTDGGWESWGSNVAPQDIAFWDNKISAEGWRATITLQHGDWLLIRGERIPLVPEGSRRSLTIFFYCCPEAEEE